jgi:phosphoglycerate-specific signal transduction histidine kinase
MYIPDIGPSGVVKGFVALVQDVSEIRRNERLLADQRVRMINSSKLAAIGEMAGSLAHEINNPLSVIHGRSERLRFLAADNNLNVPEVVKTAEKIEATAMRISKIVGGLRTLSRDAEKDTTEKTRISNLIVETIELSLHRFRHHLLKRSGGKYSILFSRRKRQAKERDLVLVFHDPLSNPIAALFTWMKRVK